MSVRDAIIDLKHRISEDIIGQEHIVERLVIGLLANVAATTSDFAESAT